MLNIQVYKFTISLDINKFKNQIQIVCQYVLMIKITDGTNISSLTRSKGKGPHNSPIELSSGCP